MMSNKSPDGLITWSQAPSGATPKHILILTQFTGKVFHSFGSGWHDRSCGVSCLAVVMTSENDNVARWSTRERVEELGGLAFGKREFPACNALDVPRRHQWVPTHSETQCDLSQDTQHAPLTCPAARVFCSTQKHFQRQQRPLSILILHTLPLTLHFASFNILLVVSIGLSACPQGNGKCLLWTCTHFLNHR